MSKSVRRRKDEEQNVEKRIHLKKFTDERQCKKRKWNANNGLHYRKRKIECKTSKNKKISGYGPTQVQQMITLQTYQLHWATHYVTTACTLVLCVGTRTAHTVSHHYQGLI